MFLLDGMDQQHFTHVVQAKGQDPLRDPGPWPTTSMVQAMKPARHSRLRWGDRAGARPGLDCLA